MPEPTLHYSPSAFESQVVLLALAEKGASVAKVAIEGTAIGRLDPDFVRAFHACAAPALEAGDARLVGAAAIVRYIDENFAGPSLAEVDAEILDRWLAKIALLPLDELSLATPPYPLPFARAFSRRRLRAEGDEASRLAHEHPDLAAVYKAHARTLRQWRRTLDDEWRINDAYRALSVLLDNLESDLEANRFVAGERYSIADAFTTALLARLEALKLTHLWAGVHPAVTAYFDAMKARPNYAAAIPPGSAPRLFSDRVFFRTLLAHIAAPVLLAGAAILLLVFL